MDDLRPEIAEKFSAHLRQSFQYAAELTLELKNRYVNPEHLLFGLAETKGAVAYEVLRKSGLKLDTLRDLISVRNEPVLRPGQTLTVDDLQLSLPAKRAVEKSVLVAANYQHKYVGTEHLFWGLLEIGDPTLEQIMKENQINIKEARQQLLRHLKNATKFPDISGFFDQKNVGDETMTVPAVPARGRGDKTPALDFFTTNLTDKVTQKTIDPIIGRQDEIDRLIHILSRRTKNNPVLIGDPGVGKTAIVEGLAKKILQEDVPVALLSKRILALDLGLVIAGTIYRGEFESRVKQIIEEIKADPNIILFIDELHTIIGAGSASGSMDAANMLKPALAKGQIRTIGATTLEEYKKHIESDPALERRFQPVMVKEPTAAETLEILRGIKDNYERFHHVQITDAALDTAVTLSTRYIQDRFLPDKAIDLIDEAASKVKVSKGGTAVVKQIRALEKDLEAVHRQKHEAIQQEQFQKASSLKAEEQQLLERAARLRERETKSPASFIGSIGKKEIAEVVSRMTGVPLADLVKEERDRLLHLEELLKRRIVGQDEAIKTLADFIRRSRVGLSNPRRPIGSFIFLGPSGVGKTETAKEIARLVFEDESALIRIDMSEFQESFNISKLIGAPAGYVGYREGTKLTDAVKRQPYAVVLFDEIEKAHPDVFNLLLQVLDEGHLTDAVGKTVNFKNTIIIMTSNIGLQSFNRVQSMGFELRDPKQQENLDGQYEELKDQVLQDLQRNFRPEFLNRIDKIIVYRPLNLPAVEKIVDLQIGMVQERLVKQRLRLQLSLKAKQRLAELGFTPEYGARAVNRVIQEHVENQLAAMMLSGAIKEGQTVRIAVNAKNDIVLQRIEKRT